EDSGDRIARSQPDESFGPERGHPAAVEIDDSRVGVQNLEDLLLIRFSVLEDRFFRELLAGGRAAGKISDETRKITDQKNGRVAQILKVLHFASQNRVTQVDIGCARIEACFDAQRLSGLLSTLQLFDELFFPNYVDRPFPNVFELLGDRR